MLRFSCGVLVVCLGISVVHAKDLSIQQTGFNNALRKFERAEEAYKADAQAVADTEKAIEKKKAQLLDEQKKADLSKRVYQEAKEKLEQAQEILDRAWKE